MKQAILLEFHSLGVFSVRFSDKPVWGVIQFNNMQAEYDDNFDLICLHNFYDLKYDATIKELGDALREWPEHKKELQKKYGKWLMSENGLAFVI